MRISSVLLLCGGFLAGCDRPVSKSETQVRMALEKPRDFNVDLEPLVHGRKLKAVWVQTSTAGQADVSAQGNELLLMGVDSGDGRGVRELSSEKRNFFKPLISPDGEKIVFTDRAAGPRIFVEPWAGGEPMDVGEGVAVAFWKDPAAGVDWIYALEQIDAGAKGGLVGKRLVRFHAETPSEREIVWGQTPMDADGFQLSRDGFRASALLPSPEASQINFHDSTWKKLGAAAWPGMAPDNSYIAWSLNAESGVLKFHQPNVSDKWEINLGTAPGLGSNAKIWHARWTNDPTLITFTGPYLVAPNNPSFLDLKDGTSGEIFIARLGPGLTEVVAAVQLTKNDRGDSHPDVWVEDSEGQTLTNFPQAPADLPDAVAKPWPSNLDAVQFAFDSAAKDVSLPGEAGARSSRVFGRNFAKLDRHWNLDFSRGYFEADAESSSKLASAVNTSHEFSIEAMLTETRDGIDPLSVRLLGYRTAAGLEMFGIYRVEGNLVLRIRLGTSPETSAVFPIKLTSFRIDPDRPYHLSVVIEGQKVKTYIDSSIVSENILDAPGLGGWSEGVLQIGDPNPLGAKQWTGKAESIAVYGRALPTEEVLQNFDAAKQKMGMRKSADRIKVRAKLEEVTPLPPSAVQGPYPRVMTSRNYKVVEVLAGICEDKFITVNHDAVLNQNVVPGLPGNIGQTYDLLLEPAAQHPELKAARIENTSSHVDLPVFVDVNPTP